MTALFENLESVAALVAPVSSESYRLTPTIFSSRLLTDITCQPIYPGATPNVSSPEDWTRAEQTRLVAAWKTWWEKSSKADRESWQKDGLRAALSLLNARNLAERGWAIFHLRRQTGICPSFALDLSPEQDAEWVEIWAQWGKAFLSKERDAWRFDQVMRTRAALAEGSAEEKRRAVEALSFILAGTFPKEPDELRCWLAWSADRLKYQSLSDRLEIDPGLPLDVKKILTEQFKDKLEPQAILSAEEDPFDKNLVWVRMKGGFVQVLDKTGHPLKLDNDTRSEPVQVQHFENAILALTGILPEADEMVFSRGQIFVATKNGLLVYRRNAKTWMRMAVEGKSDLSDVPITEMRLKGDRLNMIVQEKPRIYDVEKQRWVVPE